MNFKENYSQKKKELDKRLEKFLIQKEKTLMYSSEKELHNELCTFVLAGGKRVRGVLCSMCYNCLGGQNKELALNLSLSLELLHAHFLIHDDIMDSAALRRGKPTVHKVFEKKHNNSPRASRIGEHLALLIGDIALSYSLEVLFSLDTQTKLSKKLSSLVNEITTKTCFGQGIEYNLQFEKENSEKEILEIYYRKTAAYSFFLPLKLGALLADADENTLQSLEKFSYSLGLLFQIQDDLLDIFGKEKVGKTLFGDLYEKKRTLLLHYALSQSKCVQEIFEKEELSQTDCLELQSLFVKTGAKQYCENLIQKYYNEAQATLEKSSLSKETNSFLKNFLDFIKERDK
ncbi:MAG: polyprenyl synthetase family protein [Candidatus Woesearchaeota archaeon]|nr:polyprenyl synthetase family protein [Nanoarchaeota archaeon]USN44381.1 MAG: polyprenyl synthetase family protein [Candidatus Woesearchaeota archaeon]